jgi:hypothetical protein
VASNRHGVKAFRHHRPLEECRTYGEAAGLTLPRASASAGLSQIR